MCACIIRTSKGLSLGARGALGKSIRPFTVLYIMQSFICFLRVASVEATQQSWIVSIQLFGANSHGKHLN